MKTRAKGSFLLLALISGFEIAMPESARADGDALHIEGFVLDNSGDPAVGLEVIGDNYVGDLYSSITDSTGYYEIEVEPEVNLRVEVNCEQLHHRGFSCVPAEMVTTSSDDIRVDFRLSLLILRITSSSLPSGNIGMVYSAQLQAEGTEPFKWQLAPDSSNLPGGLVLGSNGVISGTPITSSQSDIKVQVTDANLAVTNKVFPLVVNPRPILSAPVWETNRVSMWLTGASNQNYTIEASANLSFTNWTTLFVTNSSHSGSYLVFDSQATNRERFYRVLIGP